jgi:broad specificity phosphatase PhoE
MADLQGSPRTIFWLVRHGQTDWNLQGRFQGQADPSLNQTGLAEAARAAKILASRPLGAIYSSDLLRARQTAEIIARAAGAPLRLDARLREVALGEWEGQLFSAIKVRYPAEIQEREDHPLNSRPPGGETLAELWLRVRLVVAEIAARHPGEEIALVSHGLTLAALIASMEDHDLALAFQRLPPNAEPRQLVWMDGLGQDHP